MFIKRNRRRVRGKVYEYGFLVTSVNTAKGPRHRVDYSLGRLDGIDPACDRQLAAQLETILSGQQTIREMNQTVKDILAKLKPAQGRAKRTSVFAVDDLLALESACVEPSAQSCIQLPVLVSAPSSSLPDTVVTANGGPDVWVNLEQPAEPPEWLELNTKFVAFHDAREAGPVHVGHQMWDRLGLTEILRSVGLTDAECELSQVLTLNRLIEPASEHATPDWASRTALKDIANAR